MQYGYIRCKAEDVENSKAELKDFAVAEFFVDTPTEDTEVLPPALTELLGKLEPRDEIIVKSCTSLSKDENQLQKIIAKIRSKKASVRFLDLSNHGMENPALRALKQKQTQRWV